MNNSNNQCLVTMNEILDRLERLEKENEQLKKENAALITNETEPKRCITQDICNFDKAKELFAVGPKKGKVVKDKKEIHNNFCLFYQNIFRALNPTVRIYNERQSLIYTPIKNLTDDEYRIYLAVLEDVIEVIYKYQKQLKELKD